MEAKYGDRKYVPNKGTDKVPELREVEISNLPKKQFKVMTIRCSRNLGNDWMNRVGSLKFLTKSLGKCIKKIRRKKRTEM